MSDTDQLPLVIHHQTNPRSSSFFSRVKNNLFPTIKNITLTAAGTFSGYMYWPSSFQAASFGGRPLQYVAAVGGAITNAIFNIESFFNLFELPSLHKMPLKYLSASIISFFCVLPNFLMNIEDEKGDYIGNGYIVLEGIIGLLNVVVNIVGTIELIDSISNLYKNKTWQEKEKLIAKFVLAIKIFSRLKPEEQTEAEFHNILNEQFESLSYSKQIARYSIKGFVGIFSVPQLLAYTLISYFDVKKLVKDKIRLGNTGSTVLGLLAAIGNTIPGAGFSIKGLNSICEKLICLEKPSLLAVLFILPALTSGFTTHKAMADSLNHLGYSDDFTEVLKWSANLGAALIYNLPQLIFLADRISAEKNNELSENIKNLVQTQKAYIESLNTNPYQTFMTALANGQLQVAPYDVRQHNDHYQETSMTYASIQSN